MRFLFLQLTSNKLLSRTTELRGELLPLAISLLKSSSRPRRRTGPAIFMSSSSSFTLFFPPEALLTEPPSSTLPLPSLFASDPASSWRDDPKNLLSALLPLVDPEALLVAANGDTLKRKACLSCCCMDSLDSNDFRLVARMPSPPRSEVFPAIILPVLAEAERSSSTFKPFHVFLATLVNFRLGLMGGDPWDITFTSWLSAVWELTVELLRLFDPSSGGGGGGGGGGTELRSKFDMPAVAASVMGMVKFSSSV